MNSSPDASLDQLVRLIHDSDPEVLIAAAGDVDEEDFALGGGRAPDSLGDGVGGFERRNDAFG